MERVKANKKEVNKVKSKERKRKETEKITI